MNNVITKAYCIDGDTVHIAFTDHEGACPHLVRQDPGDLIGVCFHDPLQQRL